MSRARDRYGENIEDREAKSREPQPEAERKKHAEERELAPEIPVEPVENREDAPAAAPDAPGPRHGDQR